MKSALFALALLPLSAQAFEYAKHIQKEIHCLAENVYHEARNQSKRGQLAVLHVTQNRANKQNKHLCDIVWAPKQFSWTINPPAVTEQKSWEASYKLAHKFYFSRANRKDFTKGST